MTPHGIDACSSVPLFVEAYFGETLLGVATAFTWLRHDCKLSLLTNWHVASGRNHETGQPTQSHGGVPDHLRVHVPLADRAKPPRIVHVPTIDAEGAPLWTEHPQHRKDIDVVSLEIDVPPSGFGLIPLNAIPMAPLKQRVGMPVFILGFPFGRMGIGMPVWKQGSFASEPFLANGMDHRFLIVDTASRPGMSGSPVIQRVHGAVELEDSYGRISNGDGACNFIGIYSGRFHTNDPSDAQLGRVWPAALVAEVVAAAQRRHAATTP